MKHYAVYLSGSNAFVSKATATNGTVVYCHADAEWTPVMIDCEGECEDRIAIFESEDNARSAALAMIWNNQRFMVKKLRKNSKELSNGSLAGNSEGWE